MANSTTTTTTKSTTDSNQTNQTSCNALDLSWLSPAVVEAALDMKHVSLSDVDAFHESLRCAEDYGAMDRDVSERLHERISAKEVSLVDTMVAHETVRVTKRMGLFHVLKKHKVWEQVQYMADQHGQGAYIVMSEFNGLKPADIEPSLEAFQSFIGRELANSTQVAPPLIRLPFSGPGQAKDLDERARTKIEQKVAAKVVRAYQNFYNALRDQDQGGYDKTFLETHVKHSPEQLATFLGMSLAADNNNVMLDVSEKNASWMGIRRGDGAGTGDEDEDEDRDNDRGFKTDDETDDDDDDDDHDDVDDDDDRPHNRFHDDCKSDDGYSGSKIYSRED